METEPSNPKVIKNMEEKAPSEFNIYEVRGWIIDRFQKIENAMDVVITDYFLPANKINFERVMLNSSILSIGSKLKILANIKSVSGKTVENIRQLSSIRNGFAHALIEDVGIVQIIISDSSEIGSMLTSEETSLEVMNSQGKIVTKLAVDYFADFQRRYEETKDDFLKVFRSSPGEDVYLNFKTLSKSKAETKDDH